MQLAFHLADKYNNPVVVLTDAIIGQMAESLNAKTLDYGPPPEKDWAIRGKAQQADGERRAVHPTKGHMHVDDPRQFTSYRNFIAHLDKKYRDMKENEVRFEEYHTDDAEVVLVSFGYSARCCKEAVDIARLEGIKAGLLRPVTLWPFPTQELKQIAGRKPKFLVVEDNMGQMLGDVKVAVGETSEVHLVGFLDRHLGTDAGLILPDTILSKIKELA
jgi:pyruvate/2-oxoacid:ferredoxin oxidoreductase alpha subunit